MRSASSVEAIREGLTTVGRRIAEAAAQAGRDPADVRLVVITKGHPLETIRAAYECGERRLGENRVEEALPKMDALQDLPGIEWHLVGPLQSRKIRLVGDRFSLIHSVARLKVARRLDAQAAEVGRRQPVLLECNVTGEATKAGWRLEAAREWEDALPELQETFALPNLAVRGLMTMAPQTDDIQTQRAAFRRLADVRRRLADALGLDLPELSIGMSDDFEAAVLEGATLVRIGRAILGERM